VAEPVRRLPSARRIASSTLLAAAAGFLAAGVAIAVGFVVEAGKDAATSLGERIALAVMGLIYYGPALLLGAWPVGLPIIAALGLALAFVPRPSFDGIHPGLWRAVRAVRVALIGYAGVVVVTWLVLLFG
jgi:hypothetical protein